MPLEDVTRDTAKADGSHVILLPMRLRSEINMQAIARYTNNAIGS